MATVTVKIPEKSRVVLAALAAQRKRPMSEVLEELIERERRHAFLEAANLEFARLQADPEAWADYRAELLSMEGTLMDGLADHPWTE